MELKKINPYARHCARRCLVQSLYQWQLSNNELSDIERQAVEDPQNKKMDFEYFKELLYFVVQHVQVVDKNIMPFLDRTIEKLDPVELAIIRMSTYELLHRIEIPYRVIINEGIELAKLFGSEDSHKYVNGVLDKLARKLRVSERKISNTTNTNDA